MNKDPFCGPFEADQLETFIAKGVNPAAVLPNLTQYEQASTNLEYNLCDAHSHQWQDPTQLDVIPLLPSIYLRSACGRQHDIEAEFQRTFFGLAGQHSMRTSPYRLLSNCASASIDIVATYLGARNMSVGLLQPCIDAQVMILRQRKVRLIPIAESMLAHRTLDASLLNLLTGENRPDALLITLPNNPTGFALDQTEFEFLAHTCKATGTLLIIDWAFRFYESYETWDQYAILNEIGVEYVCIEDTGKTWPTLNQKCSILVASPRLYPDLRELHNNVTLYVSPLVLCLLTAYLADSQERGLDSTVRDLIRTNRDVLHQALSGSVLAPATADRTGVSVEWIRIESADLTGPDLADLVRNFGIGILPGDFFYWADPQAGSYHVRFALAREATHFALACRLLRSLIAATPRLRSAGAA
ncbi:aminotransferase class I/II-fold pyridoxal phosphate-dependent enzyme [Nocardia macrotermitis]|uniref:Aminotransferase class I/classII large domain-containing protein n=1 Tax=Nocardia macrotermitis TaxID=2585198 RepID=A0A7K0D9B7_9NOCA|nr:aminotransferase class I/II-fold pyridoxal phosphate-dependent enzyme [Nocardia macrotermitis]MQY22298.1 hypothetical protein [Nocardia macrotermitis]